jgi:putative flippase GtrA
VGAQWANAIALLLTAVGNTALNRRHTFGVRGRTDRIRHQVQGLVVLGVGLVLTAGSLAVLHALAPDASRALEVGVLVLANLGATLVRFLLFRSWVFSSARRGTTDRPVPVPAQTRTDRRISR